MISDYLDVPRKGDATLGLEVGVGGLQQLEGTSLSKIHTCRITVSNSPNSAVRPTHPSQYKVID